MAGPSRSRQVRFNTLPFMVQLNSTWPFADQAPYFKALVASSCRISARGVVTCALRVAFGPDVESFAGLGATGLTTATTSSVRSAGCDAEQFLTGSDRVDPTRDRLRHGLERDARPDRLLTYGGRHREEVFDPVLQLTIDQFKLVLVVLPL